MRLPAADNRGYHREITQARVGRGSDHDLLHVLTGHLTDQHHVARRAGQRDQRLHRGQVDLLGDVIPRVVVGKHLHEVGFALLGPQERPHLFVGGEHGAGSAELGPHVRDHMPVHRGQLRQPRTVILDDPVHAAVDAMAAEHLQDDVLGAYPGRQLPGQSYPPDLGHPQVDRFAGDRHRHLDAAQPDRQHAQRAGRRGMTVRADHRLARDSEALHVGGVRDAVAGLGVPQPEPLTGRAQELVVFGVLAVGLQQVVVDVLHRHLGTRPVQAERLQLEHDHGAGGVLGQGLVDA